MAAHSRFSRHVLALTASVGAGLLLAATQAAGSPPAPLPFDPRDPALICKGMNGKVGRSEALRRPAAGLVDDGAVQLADATTGNIDAEDNLDLFEKLGLMEGHLMIGKALVDARMQRDALPHFGHPVRELYDYLKPMFKARHYPEFERELADLEQRVKRTPEDPATTAAYNDVLAKIDGLRRTIPASFSGSARFMTQGIALMMEAAGGDLGESLERGRITNTVEYHDAMGFARYADKVLAANAALLSANAGRIAAEMKTTLAAFPSLAPPSRPTRSVSDLMGAASRVRDMAK
ncbi:hypothetical protein FHP25_21365 [Vineibacter terrae]|uniref:Uncharacterized protein n=1 Tax=Vineibacter terrae TaxID=2586908 RepID=A0A5C8PIF9_9HYPH|nr:hypothetical protein [Vineibacter terrae]TXL73480.1 hypothetical protein FHP25_21365 [Vineibacter terrae]